jgi:O-antigen/teichoic acid export membrane protein
MEELRKANHSVERTLTMRTTALIASFGLLLAIGWYLLNQASFEAEGVEWAVLALALTSPVVTIVALLPRRARGGVTRTVAVIANGSLVATVFAYLAGRPHFDLEGPELLLFAFLLAAPCLGVIALVRRHAATEPNAAPNAATPPSVS